MPRLALAELGIAPHAPRRDPGRGARRSRTGGRRRPRCRRRGGRRRDACGARGRAGRWPRGRRGGREGCRADAAPRRAVRHRCGSGDRHRGRPRRRDEPRRRGPAGRDGRDGGRAARRVPRHRPGALHGEARRQGAGAATRRAARRGDPDGSPRPAASPQPTCGSPCRSGRGTTATSARPARRGHPSSSSSTATWSAACGRSVRVATSISSWASAARPRACSTAAAVRGARRLDAGAARAAVGCRGGSHRGGGAGAGAHLRARRAVRGRRVALPDRGDPGRPRTGRATPTRSVVGASAPTGRRRSHRRRGPDSPRKIARSFTSNRPEPALPAEASSIVSN